MSAPPPVPPKTRAPVLPRSAPAMASPAAGAGPAAVEDLRAELQGWFDLSPLGQLVFDDAGTVLRQNAALAALVGALPVNLRDAAPELRLLLGWPAELPAVAAQGVRDGWVTAPDGEPVRLRVRVRGLAAGAGSARLPGAAPLRWIALLEDRRLEDERDLARVEIQALMGTAGIGVATWDAARGWVGSAQRGAGAPDGSVVNGDGERQGNLMAVGRDLVEPESMADYERLQAALRTRSRIEVRYAVRHRESGRRWLMTRVEPAELGPQRGAFSVVTMDVTEEETARRRNQDLLDELSTILDVSPAGIAYLRGDQLVRCNRRFETLLNSSAGVAPGTGLDRVLAGAGVEAATVDGLMRAVRGLGAMESELALPAGPRRPTPIWCSIALRRTHERRAGAVGMVVVLSDATRLKAQQAELEALSRERELMFNLSDVGIVYQRDGQIERANQAMAELVGIPPEQLKGAPMARLYESERAWQHHVGMETHEIATLGRSHDERRLRRADGTLFWVQVSQRPVAADRPSAGTILSFVNIDDRQRARESLLQQADRTRAVLDSVLVGIVTVAETGIEWMNRSARRMFGGELADFVGAPMATVATDELDHPLRRTDWARALEDGQAGMFECRLRARDGRTFWVVGNVIATGQEGGRPQLTFALLDIERRRQAEVSIVQARASLQRIIETAPLAIALFDAASQQVVQLNQMAATFAGRPMGEVMGKVPAQFLPGPEGAKLATDLHRALASPDAVQRELRRGADDAQRVWDIRIVSLRSAADAPDQLLMVASDVTAQRHADEARLAAAIAQREMLIKEVHHRIKNNLQGVAGLLQQSASRHPEAAAAIAEAVGQVHAIAQVHGLQVGVTGPMRVRGVVEAIAGSVQRMFGRTIHVAVEGPAPHRFALSEADSIPIALTINELLTNAIKHSPAGAEIRCRLDCDVDSVLLAIANPGVLKPGFSLAAVPAGVSGLGLVRSLLPRKGARMAIEAAGPDVVASLALAPPAVTLLDPS